MANDSPRRTKLRSSGLHHGERLLTEATAPPLKQRHQSRIVAVRRARRRILMLLCIVLAGVVSAAVLSSPLLSVKRLQMSGVESMLPDESVQTMRFVSLKPGTNWLLAPVGTMEQKLRELPWVQTVRVSRQIPDKIQVAMTLRESQFLAQTPFGLYELDPEGVPIRLARPEQKDRLPLIVLDRPAPIHTGIPIHDEALSAAMTLYNKATQQEMVRIAKIVVDQSGNICLNMKDGIPIQIGQAQDIDAKIGLVQNLYRHEPNIAGHVVAVNLSCPNWPACTPRDTKPSDASASRAVPLQESVVSERK